jgi:hypothetical protein
MPTWDYTHKSPLDDPLRLAGDSLPRSISISIHLSMYPDNHLCVCIYIYVYIYNIHIYMYLPASFHTRNMISPTLSLSHSLTLSLAHSLTLSLFHSLCQGPTFARQHALLTTFTSCWHSLLLSLNLSVMVRIFVRQYAPPSLLLTLLLLLLSGSEVCATVCACSEPLFDATCRQEIRPGN